MADTFAEHLVTALRRVCAAQVILVFGSPESRRQVEMLGNRDVSEEQKDAIRLGLDRVADKLTGSNDG